MSAVYGDLDVVVNCSRNEGTPVALIEALAAARPRVATAGGGPPALLRGRQHGARAAPRRPRRRWPRPSRRCWPTAPRRARGPRRDARTCWRVTASRGCCATTTGRTASRLAGGHGR